MTLLGPNFHRSLLLILCDLPLLPLYCIKLGQCLLYVTIQNLVYICRNVYLTTLTNNKVPLMHYDQYARQLFKIAIQPFKGPQVWFFLNGSNWTKGACMHAIFVQLPYMDRSCPVIFLASVEFKSISVSLWVKNYYYYYFSSLNKIITILLKFINYLTFCS